MTKELKVLCGVPGVGKSTWTAKEADRLEREGFRTKIVSRDKIRFDILDARGGGYFDHENEVFKTFVSLVDDALANGVDYVFADATHINRVSRAKLLSRLSHLNPETNIVFEVFWEPTRVAIERNNQRTGLAKVPEGTIRSMVSHFTIPDAAELDSYKNSCVVMHKGER